jgi:glyoxylase-like metal-dependent hydrolase (beta-lactamase superfamily II)
MAFHSQTLVVGSYLENCYLYWNDSSLEVVIIDPGDESDRIADRIAELELIPKAVLLTHGHLDHIGAVDELRSRYDIPLLMGAGEEVLLADPIKNGSALLGDSITARPPEKLLADEDLVKLGSIELRVLATPGHSPAGICFLDERNGWLYCGDTLFAQSIGRTDLYGASYETLIRSIQQKILRLPDKVICFPGHGPATTVGAERTGNPFLTGGYLA